LQTRLLRLTRLLILLLHLYLDARFRVPHLPAAHRRRVTQRWARRMLHTLRIEVRARGHVPAPGAPLLLVANHVSWLDSYALNTLSAARFVAKSEVCEWPLIGSIAAGFGTFFLKRGCYRAAARMVGGLAEVLCAAQPVGVFPEGTTSAGDGLLRFYPAMFQAAVLSGARVQPVAIRYRAADGAPTGAAAYVGDMSVLDSTRRLLREPRLTAELVFCAPLDPGGRTRRELAALTRAAIAAALGLEDDAVGPTSLRRAA
jgi:1-acyl-sn-glycerol-3-phosphate acyltransferase